MLLNDEKVALRALEAEDLDTIYRWENDTTLWDSASNIAPYSRKQIWEYINNYDGDIYTSHQLRLVITPVTDPTCAVGMIDLTDFDPVNRRAEVGILIQNDYRQQGYGSAALKILARYAHQRLGIHQLYAVVRVSNAPGIALFKSVGYKVGGRLRSWLRCGESYDDILLLQTILTPNNHKG